MNIEQNSEAMVYAGKANGGRRITPTIVFPDGVILAEPSNAELAQQLGLSTVASRTFYDVVIVGVGPAGTASAIYTAREGLDKSVIEQGAPGFDEGITGEEFALRLTKQVAGFGAEVLQAQEVTMVRTNGRYREVLTADGTCYAGRVLILATGARYRRLEAWGEAELIGINVH